MSEKARNMAVMRLMETLSTSGNCSRFDMDASIGRIMPKPS